jgi:hypothetical protein
MNPSDPAAPPEDLHPTARIATVVFNPPPDPDASDLRQPYITFQGVEELFGGPVFIRTGDATPGTGGEVRVSGSFLLPEDSDGDGLVDPFDNCTWVDNFFQIDDGSVETPLNPGGILWDGIGKKCQCGDARFLDGRVVGADSGGILDIVVGKSLDPESENLASTEGDPQVNLLDWLTVELNRDGRGLVGPSCPPARPPQ